MAQQVPNSAEGIGPMIRHGASAVGESRRGALTWTESPGNAAKTGRRDDIDEADDDHDRVPNVDADVLWTEMGLDRRDHDIQLRDTLEAEGFAGPAWKTFAEELAAYGLAVLYGWMRSGYIRANCAQRGIRLERPLHWTEQDWEDLTNTTVLDAIIKFRDHALIAGKWDPTRNASLKTFFIGRCIYCFANAYRPWLTHQGRFPLTDGDKIVELAQRGGHSPVTPEARVLSDFEVAEALRPLDPVTRSAVQLQAQGYSHNEIAEILGTTPDSVRGVLTRQRKRGRSRKESDGRGHG
ncbi:sigma-70 family RNA polymerase sigma factor [Amycolatopsis acidicola]|uniref:Sigma-70 family RNA polymerase sigma factor n=1 Tax=Amycolatopsis acidicola TaxID=2596893 RepID=A0A5N0VKH3_9PSEU|nr:sigma factor-like helix-turn-helix DNA-binding protein [Amycolatopsis acidicola]KAA9165844.1 sigma-70 family RNA polymerase sigma factor [Amycolatopsis acidicola]